GDAGGRKVKGTIHWVAAETAFDCQAYLYDRLFSVLHPDTDKDVDFKSHLNPNSRIFIEHAKGEPALQEARPGVPVQFERNGYFSADPVRSRKGQPVFNRAVTLRDSWAKG
ncbi:MAG: glutamine--tRNA ligase, partial [Desulfobulbaceae bacterium]|nr:glutamine--tRNA ligase [Desulfobulbaceae bacterium]